MQKNEFGTEASNLLSKSFETQWFTTDAFSLVARRSLEPTSIERTSMQLASSCCFCD
ncbi:hypothetical protein [Candidatus Enterococcus clewellii]|uniref:hypothetical protein n=1 Tax=Candidatus Enterococcus clewellii TaxID=1834193 RepID=UPI0030D0E0A7